MNASKPRSISPAVMRIVDGLCDQFERAWKVGSPVLEEYLAQAPADVRLRVLPELAAIELQYRDRGQAGGFSFDELVAVHPAIADELRLCADEIGPLVGDGVTKRRG